MTLTSVTRPAGRAVAAWLATLAIIMVMTGVARAEEHHFCYGANVAPGSSCQSGLWYMTGGYANSSNGPVCLYMAGAGLSACDRVANEGVYVSGYGYYQRATIFHYNSFTIKVYGAFWT